jgi:endonuclease-3
MPTTTNKQKVLTLIFTALKKRYETGDPEPRPVLEQLVYAICREGATRAGADRAYRLLQERFFDWNEIRVSSPLEIAEVLDELPHAHARAQRIISLLQEVFETNFSFDLEPLHKKGLKQAAKHLSRYEATNDYTVSWAVQQSLGGHAIPLDDPTLRCLRRLRMVDDEEENLETVRVSLEHLVPKVKGTLFIDLLSALADELCTEDDPRCNACPLQSECPVGQEARASVSSRGGRVKPR